MSGPALGGRRDAGTDPRLLRLHETDDCLVAACYLLAGSEVLIGGVPVTLATDVPLGHKVAARPVRRGEDVRKCGAVIGRTTQDVTLGEHVHLHNLRSNYLDAHLAGGARPRGGEIR